ncbi:ribulose-phosphate 3-epimerase [Oligella ureolytica]
MNPGFGGQKFIPSTMDKVAQLRKRIDDWVAAGGQPIRLEVDGGIKADNIGAVRAAGADTFVAGSAIFGADNYQEVIQQMRQEIDLANGKLINT